MLDALHHIVEGLEMLLPSIVTGIDGIEVIWIDFVASLGKRPSPSAVSHESSKTERPSDE
jgi:hypothetical protein